MGLTLESMASVYILADLNKQGGTDYSTVTSIVQSASSESHVASKNRSSICPKPKACSCAISVWMAWGALVPWYLPLHFSRPSWQLTEHPHSSTDAPVSVLARPGTGGDGGLRKVSQHGTCQSHWARMLALTVLSPYHQTLERGAVQ